MSIRQIAIILLFLNSFFCISQVTKSEKDSTNFYQRIEAYSKQRKATKFFHKLLFKSTYKKAATTSDPIPKLDLTPLEGRIIRTIKIVSHDPFGYSFTDSTETANSLLEKAGNAIHIKTRKFTIRNFLLFKENTPLDILSLEESERLLRSQNYIRSVEIVVDELKTTKDSVDVLVDVLDSWSIIPRVSGSTSRTRLRLKDRNFLGYGHQFDNSITTRLADGKNAYNLRYMIPNFKNTFVNTSVGYITDLNGFYSKYVDISRPFYSPLARWAGGIYLDEQYRQQLLLYETQDSTAQNFKYRSQDIWAGHSFDIFKGNSDKERTTKLISSIRFLNLDYKDSPSSTFDSAQYFTSEAFYMGSLGITSRQYVKDSYIFRDGITEDVPVGTVYSITGGIQHKNKQNRPYVGAKISHGNYFNWGYLSTNFEYGTFINEGQMEQTAYSFQANYFTKLISMGSKWKMRQFIKPQFLIGTNRLNSPGDRITIDENNQFIGVYSNEDQRNNNARIQGFNSGLMGTKKYVLSLQTQFYSPWEVLGFRLNPYLNFTSAMLGEEGDRISKSKVYSSFGVGFIIRNDYLVFSSFQLSFSFFPSIPGQGNNVFDTNTLESDDFGFQNFEIGRPTPVWYN